MKSYFTTIVMKRLVCLSICFATCAFSRTNVGRRYLTQTSKGLISGVEDAQNPRIISFKGIPYATPPVGQLRWRDPRPASNWSGIRSGENFGKACIQPLAYFDVLKVGDQSENCLYLNVWTPHGAFTGLTEKKPVLFYIHGGSFTSGAGHIYPGAKLAEQDIVVVTFNYRLGNLGFLTHKGLSQEAPDAVGGNYGLMDQALALKWVRENISKFGGDPNQVTIHGQSAGASSVAYMMVSPATRGLFKRAIMQSGYASTAKLDLAKHEKNGSDYATKLGCFNPPTAVACLRAKNSSVILDSMNDASFGPIVDGTYIPDTPNSLFERGQQAQVPILLSETKDEAYIFTKPMQVYFVWQYKLKLEELFKEFAGRVFDAFPAKSYSEVPDTMARVATAAYYAAPIRRFLSVLSATHAMPTYQLYFTRLSEYAAGYEMGVFHGLDLFYLFNWIEGRDGFDQTDKLLERALQSSYASFVKTGNPENDFLRQVAEQPQDGQRLWYPHDQVNQHYLEFGDVIKQGANICSTSSGSCDLFDEIERAQGKSPLK